MNVDALPPPAACRLYVKIHASCQPLEMMTALQPSIVENGARRSRRCGQAPQHTHVPVGNAAERSPSLKWQSLARCGVQAELLMNPCLQYFCNFRVWRKKVRMYNRGTVQPRDREQRAASSPLSPKRLMRVPRKNAPISKSDVYLSLVLGTGCWKALVE